MPKEKALEGVVIEPKCKNCLFQESSTKCKIHVWVEISDDYSCDAFQVK